MLELLTSTTIPEVDTALQHYIATLREQFDVDLTAVYVLGSVSTGDYLPDWSDVDLLIITARALPDAEERVKAAEASLRAAIPTAPAVSGVTATVSALRQPDWRTNPIGIVTMLGLIEHGLLVWGAEVRHLFIVPTFPSLRAYVVAEMARIIRERPDDLPVAMPRGPKWSAYTRDQIGLVNWLYYPARIVHLLETGHSGSKAAAVTHYVAHHDDGWTVWLRWAEAYRHLPNRPRLKPAERRSIAFAARDYFWEVVNHVLLGLGHDPETLDTEAKVLAAFDRWLRTA